MGKTAIAVLGSDLGKSSCSVAGWTPRAPSWCGAVDQPAAGRVARARSDPAKLRAPIIKRLDELMAGELTINPRALQLLEDLRDAYEHTFPRLGRAPAARAAASVV